MLTDIRTNYGEEYINMKSTITAAVISIIGALFFCTAMIGMCLYPTDFVEVLLFVSFILGIAMLITGIICLLVGFAKK